MFTAIFILYELYKFDSIGIMQIWLDLCDYLEELYLYIWLILWSWSVYIK